jgi:hypothetical protein
VKSRRSIVAIDGFYSDPDAIRRYALKQSFYTPYESSEQIAAGERRASWFTSRFKTSRACPFKASRRVVAALEEAVGERIDMDHWRAAFPVNREFQPAPEAKATGPRSCVWNCCFHVKPDNGQRLGEGVHNHVTDRWNSVGADGWTGIIYLMRLAPLDGGLHLWRNIDAARNFDWMTPAENWERVDSFGNVFNRLLLVRGDIPHSGSRGWGDRIANGRMYQTFFFRTTPIRTKWPLAVVRGQA